MTDLPETPPSSSLEFYNTTKSLKEGVITLSSSISSVKSAKILSFWILKFEENKSVENSNLWIPEFNKIILKYLRIIAEWHKSLHGGMKQLFSPSKAQFGSTKSSTMIAVVNYMYSIHDKLPLQVEFTVCNRMPHYINVGFVEVDPKTMKPKITNYYEFINADYYNNMGFGVYFNSRGVGKTAENGKFKTKNDIHYRSDYKEIQKTLAPSNNSLVAKVDNKIGMKVLNKDNIVSVEYFVNGKNYGVVFEGVPHFLAPAIDIVKNDTIQVEFVEEFGVKDTF